MPNIVKLRDIIATFTDQEMEMTVPFDFKNPTADTINLVNEYNSYLANGQYEEAYNLRQKEAATLEPMIHDAKALNRQQAMMINTYLFATKGVTQDITLEEYKKLEAKGELAKDITYFIVDGEENGDNVSEDNINGVYSYTIREVTALPSDAASKTSTIYIVG